MAVMKPKKCDLSIKLVKYFCSAFNYCVLKNAFRRNIIARVILRILYYL
jgi:hypothetical protein